MHARTLRTAISLGILALAICLPVRAQQQDTQQSNTGDPLADAARKAKEEKKDAPKPKKVYTDDDIPAKKSDVSVVGTAAPQGDAAATTGTATTAAPAAAPTGPGAEQYWRKRFADQRAKITRAEQELDVLQREENKAGLQYYSDPTKAMKEQLTRNEINQKAAKIDAKKQEIAKLKQETDDLEDELRKAGGDPGWAR